MRYYQIINESPQTVQATNFIFDEPAKNRAFAADMLKKSVEVIEDTPDYILFRTGNERNGWLVLVNKQTQRTDFAMRFAAGRRKFLPSFVSSNVGWNDRASPHTKGLPSRMFFDFLVKRYGTVLSDRKQTADGRGFWRRQMSDAVARGLRVGLANMNMQNIAWYDPASGEALTDWIDEQDAYGAAYKYQAKRFVIISAG